MDSLQNYLEHLLNSIENKRALSLKEFYKTDLNDNETVEDMNIWYDQIISEVKKKPPEYYVRCLEIIEDINGQIQMIDYIYFDNGEDLYDTSFMKKLDTDFGEEF